MITVKDGETRHGYLDLSFVSLHLVELQPHCPILNYGK